MWVSSVCFRHESYWPILCSLPCFPFCIQEVGKVIPGSAPQPSRACFILFWPVSAIGRRLPETLRSCPVAQRAGARAGLPAGGLVREWQESGRPLLLRPVTQRIRDNHTSHAGHSLHGLSLCTSCHTVPPISPPGLLQLGVPGAGTTPPPHCTPPTTTFLGCRPLTCPALQSFLTTVG